MRNRFEEDKYMRFKKISADDAAFLNRLFSTSEYDLWFAENGTTEAEWKERIRLFGPPMQSLIVLTEDGQKVGWFMFETDGEICSVHILVFLPDERRKGYGSAVLEELIARHPEIRIIRLDVQKRNIAALAFYARHGFTVAGVEMQPVGSGVQPYFKLERKISASQV